MCGRFFRHGVSWAEYHDALNLLGTEEGLELDAAYNIAPTQTAPIIRIKPDSDDLEMISARWGLIPSWWNKPKSELKFSTFNARIETAAEKPMYRGAFKRQWCLVPASGIYEWTGPKGDKTPYAISVRNRRWFCMLGLWDEATVEGQCVTTFTILTTQPNDFWSRIHNRMAVILNWGTYRQCLETHSLVDAIDEADLYAWQIGPEVGNVRNQGEDLIAEV